MKTLDLTYEQQAEKFLKDTNTTFKAEFLKYDYYFDGDKDRRDIYSITLERGARKYIFRFGQSIRNSQQWVANTIYAKNLVHKAGNIRLMGDTRMKMLTSIGAFFGGGTIDKDFSRNKNFSEPTAYDVLTCLTKYPVETFGDFCAEYGYEEDSRQAYKTYEAVKEEWQNVAMLWNETELEDLREIQ